MSATQELVCIPANIESRLETLKSAIAQTNRLYETQRQSFITKINEQQKQNTVAPQAAEQTAKQVQKIIDDLKL